MELVHDAEDQDTLDPAVTEDTERRVRIGAAASDAAAGGIPGRALGPRKRDGKAPVRDFAGRREVAGRGTATFEHTPRLALLGTVQNRPRDWLRAGQAMERVLLRATLDGLSTSLNSHALERSELRWAARDPRSAMGFVQMMFRLGYGPAVPSTPRRPVQEVLDFE